MQSVGHGESPDGHRYQTLTTSSMASLTADTVRTKTRGTTVVNQEREEISGMSCKERQKNQDAHKAWRGFSTRIWQAERLKGRLARPAARRGQAWKLASPPRLSAFPVPGEHEGGWLRRRRRRQQSPLRRNGLRESRQWSLGQGTGGGAALCCQSRTVTEAPEGDKAASSRV